MKIKKILQKIFKTFFQFLFHVFYGKIKTNKKINQIEFKKIEIKKITIENKSYDINNSIYEIKNARIYTDTVENVAIIKDNFILPEISYQQIKGELKDVTFNKVIVSGTTRFKKKFNGNILSLIQGASGNNYFHFLFDIVTKIKLFEEQYSLKDIDYFYMPGVFDWQKKIISSFDICDEKLINSQKFRHIEANKIFAVDHPWYNKGYVQEEINNISEWIVHFLRNKFLKNKKKFNTSDRIFIDRSDSNFNHCKLINNNEIIEFLGKKGFQSYQVSKLDFFEQIYLFNNAKIILGPHGAALSNIIFSEPGLKLIELIPKDHQSVKCKRISEIMNFNYQRVNLETKKNDDIKLKGDMKIEIPLLNEILNSNNL